MTNTCSDSSIWTTHPAPPMIMGALRRIVEHISLCQRYTSIAVPLSTSASEHASVTGYCRAHQYIKITHFWSVWCDFEKNEPSRILFRVLHCLHHQLTPSVTSRFGLLTIATPTHLIIHIIFICTLIKYYVLT